MASICKVIIIGNCGKDPEMRYLANGDAVCNLTVATSETWKDKQSGEKKEAVEWHRIVVFRKLAEICGQYLKKGSSVYIEGKLKTRKWQDKDGQDRYTTEIQADEMRMLGGKSDGGSRDDGRQQPSRQPQQTPPRNAQGAPRNNFDDMDDDIPFQNPYRGRLCLAV